ncbi:hypothetical protein WMO40_10125 [Bacillaceae bacterium CLA-AA-H227]|uniref:Uncharacterized protein n=1 Tax=Robertmurraya yapensis (ex Hitch et al 2024) TaxID=3133160 RepID=A0ACC6SAD6_9BACI
MKLKAKALVVSVIAFGLMSGCSASFYEAKDEALVAVEETFKETPKDTNNKNDDIKFYLPFGFEVEEETPNNIILKNGSKTYILFYNLQEEPKSEVVLNATLQQKNYDITERFQQDDKLSYVLVNKSNDKENEVVVGIGGVKITSEVKTSSLKSEAETMMRIVKSVKANK